MAMIQCFLIAEPNVVAFKALVAKASKRAERLGFEPLTCEPAPEFDCLEEGTPIPLKGYALLGDVPETAEWRVVGSIEALPDSSESLIRGDVPDHLRHDGTVCDHCQTHRKRTLAYILRYGNGGLYKRVGRSCLEDFYASKAGEKLALYFERLMDLMEEVAQLRHYSNGGGAGLVRYFAVPEVLAVTARMVREYGWMSAARAEAEGTRSTGNRVAQAMAEDETAVAAADEQVAEQILLWLRSDSVAEAAKDSPYMHNLWAMATAGAAPEHRVSLLASAYYGWHREETSKKEAADSVVSSFVGKVGERISLVATLLRRTVVPGSQWGDKVLHSFIDDKGNRLAWFATGRSGLQVGQTYHLTGRVKMHNIYRDTMQTVLTRVTCDDLKLFDVIQKKNVKSLKKLLAQGLSVQIQDDDRAGLLHEAVRAEDEAILDVLLESPISLDLRDRSGYAPLHLAIAKGSETLVTKLLSAGATPSIDMLPLIPEDKPSLQAVLSAAFH